MKTNTSGLSKISTSALWAEIGTRTGRAIPTLLLPIIVILMTPGYFAMRVVRGIIGNNQPTRLPEIALLLVTAAWVYLVGILALLALGRY